VLRHRNNVEVSIKNNKNNRNRMMTGTIKTLVADRGFGFIAREGEAKDLFFHSKELVGVTFDELQIGDAVSFEVVESEKGPAATKVSRA
jgi:CspA family cold shock protein